LRIRATLTGVFIKFVGRERPLH